MMQKTKLIDHVRHIIRVKHYSYETEKTYIKCSLAEGIIGGVGGDSGFHLSHEVQLPYSKCCDF